ncbi:hypothetical protein SCYAM73S_05416 [Streptomyces cyaneofuscatus]
MQDGDEPVLQRVEPPQPDLPQRPAELLAPGRQKPAAGHRSPGDGVGADALELPPAGEVGDEQEAAVAVPLDLAHRLVDIAHQGPYTGEFTGLGDLRQHHHRAVPRHPGVVPGDPGGPPPVVRDTGAGDEPVAAVGEFPYGGAVLGGGAVQRYGGDHPAYVGGPGSGELLQHAPHFALLAPVQVDLRVHPAQPAADVRERGERPGRVRPVGGVGVQPLVREVDEDDERPALLAHRTGPGLSAVLDHPAARVPRGGQHGLRGAVRAAAHQGAAAALGRARLGPPHLVADGGEVVGAAVVRGGEGRVDRRRPGAVRGFGHGVHGGGPPRVRSNVTGQDTAGQAVRR